MTKEEKKFKEKLQEFMETFISGSLKLNKQETKDYIKSKKISIRILESNGINYLSIFEKLNLIYQRKM